MMDWCRFGMAIPESRQPSFRSEAHGLVFSATCLRPAAKKRGSAFPSTGPSILLRAMSKVEWLRAAVSPIPKPRKEQRPPASLFRKVPVIPYKKLNEVNPLLEGLGI
jgi:hypothetical protein